MPFLKFCWEWTVSELQGQSIEGKVLSELGISENDHGLTYTSFSRITKFGDFGLFNGITSNRLINSVFKKRGPKEC